MSVVAVRVVSVPVLESQRALDFYVGTLGFELVRDDQSVPGMRWITVRPPRSDVTLSLVTWFETMPAGSLRGLVLASNDIHADYRHLSASGVAFLQPPAEQPWGTEAVFRDPDGNELVLQQLL